MKKRGETMGSRVWLHFDVRELQAVLKCIGETVG